MSRGLGGGSPPLTGLKGSLSTGDGGGGGGGVFGSGGGGFLGSSLIVAYYITTLDFIAEQKR
jgi:hypothetical protein